MSAALRPRHRVLHQSAEEVPAGGVLISEMAFATPQPPFAVKDVPTISRLLEYQALRVQNGIRFHGPQVVGVGSYACGY